MANWIPKIEYGTIPTVISFTYPPDGDPINEKVKSYKREILSYSGNKQVSFSYFEEVVAIKFNLLTSNEINALRTFFLEHASLGNEFKYFLHSDESAFITYKLNQKVFNPERIISDGAGDFYYSITLSFKRVL